MNTPKGGEYDTYRLKSHQTMMRPDGQLGLLLTTHEGLQLVLGMDRQMLSLLVRDLAKLLAAQEAPNKPNA